MDYKNAGVDIEAGYKSVELMKKHVQETMRPEVLTNLVFRSFFNGKVQKYGKANACVWHRRRRHKAKAGVYFRKA